MNCDRVFDVLTRGPFPSGSADDVAVEHHLRACHGCRELAEALRPAVALFHESLGDETHFESLPGYYGEIPAADAEKNVLAPAKRLPRRRATASTAQQQALVVGWPIAGAFALTAVLAGLMWAVLAGSDRQPDGARQVVATPAEMDVALLDELKLVLACLEGGAKSAQVADASTTAGADYQCCLRCHAARHRTPIGNGSIAKVVRSCNACHDRGV